MKTNLISYDKNELLKQVIRDRSLLALRHDKRFRILLNKLFEFKEEQYRYMEDKFKILDRRKELTH